MRNLTILMIGAITALPAAAGETVFRCTHGTTVAYQWTTCEPEQQEMVLRIAAAPATAEATPATGSAQAKQASAAAPVQVTQRAAPQVARVSWRAQVRSPAPYVGISDDAVLNMRGWGRPTKIARTRGERAWLEHWTYLSPNGEARHLHFENGKLVTVNIEPAPYVVQMANASEPGQHSQQ